MNTLLALKILHGLASLVLFGSALALAWWSWRVRQGAVSGLAARIFRHPALFGGLLAVSALSLPLSGWWLVTLAGWPLSQTWLLGTGLLYLCGCICWLWLAARLPLATGPALRIDLALAGLGLLAFLVALLLM
ncbi:MAG: DUF2269 family protein, partial [Pseudomonas sp.]